MKYLAAIAVFAVILLSMSAAAAPILDNEAKKKIDSIAERTITNRIAPSVTVVIGTADDILYAKAYGRHTYNENSPKVTLDSIYDLASVSKAVGTATTTLLLVEDGKLKTSDKVSDFFPDWKVEDKKDITILSLLGHTSGMVAYLSGTAVEAQRKEGESKAEALLRHTTSVPLRYVTNKGYTYSCINFTTLVRVNEKVARKSQEQFLKERVFEPLGMQNSGYMLTPEQKNNSAPTGANLQGSVHDPLAAYYSDAQNSGGNAGLFASSNDLAKFCQMLLSNGKWDDKEIMKPQTIDLLASNAVPMGVRRQHAHGWVKYTSLPNATRLNQGTSKAIIGHGGFTGTFIRLDRNSGTFVIILANRTYPNSNTSVAGLRRDIIRIVMENDPVYKEFFE